MLIVTTVAGAERSGCLVGYWTKCSVRPPAQFLVCVSKKNHTFGVAMGAETLALHLIPKHEVGLARLFGSETGDEIDKFSRCSWTPGPGGVPILDDCPSHAICRIVERTDVGDHVALVTNRWRWPTARRTTFSPTTCSANSVSSRAPGVTKTLTRRATLAAIRA